MGDVATTMMLLGTGGTVLGGVAQAESGKQAAKIQEDQLRQKATEELAAAQRQQQEQRKKGEYVRSRQQAVAAKSGAGGRTVLDIMAETSAQSKYNEEMILYGGEQRSRGLKSKADATKFKGKADYTGTLLATGAKAAGKLAKGYG